jgi:oligopeptide/dipeptide ABC transporter ATP-binding protein
MTNLPSTTPASTSLEQDQVALGSAVPVLEVADLVQEFRVRRRGQLGKAAVSAVAGVSFAVSKGQTFGVVGETGSGKSTLARAVIGAPPPLRGRVLINGEDLSGPSRARSRRRGQLVQMIFQDPAGALDPKWSVERLVSEPLAIQGSFKARDLSRRVAAMLDLVGLNPLRYAERRASELSGGQAQRVAIARALIASPDLVVCDEPVTALDVSIQAQILRLLFDLKQELSLTYLLIAHDLAVVRALADRVGTMYLGKFCEVGSTDELYRNPAHPYTAALLSAIPHRPGAPARPRIRLLGEPPSPFSPPSGCRFRTRCTYAADICAEVEPVLRAIGPGHEVACHFPLSQSSQGGIQRNADQGTK